MDNLNGTRQQEMAQGPDGPKKKEVQTRWTPTPLNDFGFVRPQENASLAIHPSIPSILKWDTEDQSLALQPSRDHPRTIQGYINEAEQR